MTLKQLLASLLVALNTRNERIMCRTLKALQQLAKSGDFIGQALIPYYRQLLPIFNLFKNKNCEYNSWLITNVISNIMPIGNFKTCAVAQHQHLDHIQIQNVRLSFLMGMLSCQIYDGISVFYNLLRFDPTVNK